jgi:YVTN family beta-propeller protein
MKELAAGSVFAGHRIEGECGRGGMGVVYRAVHLALNRQVALKVIAPQYTADPQFRERFKQESEVAASIDHPHVIPIYDAGEAEDLLYVTMKYVQGTDLSAQLRGYGRLAPYAGAGMIGQVAEALDAAHRRGLVHRDVKPANVLLQHQNGGDPFAYLTDFGLTKRTATGTGLTGTGMFVGTLDYIAPEQLQGNPVDARSDVYALGCVLFQTITGRVPFPRDSEPAKMWAHMGEPPPRVTASAPDVPPGFDEVVRRAMAKEPEERYQSAGDLGRAAQLAAHRQTINISDRSVATGEAAAGAMEVPATAAATGPPLPHPRPTAPQTAAPAGPPSYPPPPRRPTQYPPPPSYGPPPSSGAKTPLIAIIGGVVGAAAIAALAVILLTGGSDKKKKPKEAQIPAIGAPIKVGKSPWTIIVGHGSVFVDNGGDGTVSRIDPRTERVKRTIRVDGAPYGMAVGPDGVWVGNYDSAITRIDQDNGSTKIVYLTKIASTDNFVLAEGGGHGWVANPTDGKLFELDSKTGKVQRRINAGKGLTGVQAVDGGAWFTRGKQMTFVDGNTGKTFAPVDFTTPLGALLLDEGTLYAPSGNSLQRVDNDTGTKGTPIPSSGDFSAFCVGGGSAWFYFPVEGTVQRVSLKTRRQVGQPLDVGKGITDMWFGEGALWLLNRTQQSVRKVTPGS